MTVRVSAVAVTVVVEEEQSDDVRCETERTDDEYELGMGDFLGFDETLNSL